MKQVLPKVSVCLSSVLSVSVGLCEEYCVLNLQLFWIPMSLGTERLRRKVSSNAAREWMSVHCHLSALSRLC